LAVLKAGAASGPRHGHSGYTVIENALLSFATQ